ncbi:MAG: preprotein translocase subunit SecG [Syntrophobacterales bacterium]|nr:preprotein translocase subunit SecG [Syntrophobacterales bacterium]
MHAVIVSFHIIICIAMILTVLLQTGKGADMGAAFGGSSQTVFGSSGPGTFLGKMTTFIAIFFMLTSLWLAYSSTHKTSSIMEGASAPGVEQTIPANGGDNAAAGGAAPLQAPVKEKAD